MSTSPFFAARSANRSQERCVRQPPPPRATPSVQFVAEKHSALFGIIEGMEKSGGKNHILVGTHRLENANVSRHRDAVGRVNLGRFSRIIISDAGEIGGLKARFRLLLEAVS